MTTHGNEAYPLVPSAAPRGWGWSDVWPPMLVALAALAVRAVYAAAIVGPPTDDPAYYVTVAQNLYAGHGFTSNVIWQYSLPFDSPTHPAGEFWMPLASWLVYGAFLIAGVSWPAAQAPGVVAGSGLALLAYAFAWRLSGGLPARRGLATAAGLLVAFNGVLAYQSVSADSSAPFALLGALALWIAGSHFDPDLPGATRPRTGWSQSAWAAVCGALTGLAYLARSDGVYVVFVMVGVTALASWRRRGLAPMTRWLAPMLAAAGAVVVPWLARNVAVFGTPFPAPASRLAFLTRYEDLFNFAAPPTVQHWWSQGLPALLSVRADALWHNWHDVLDFLFFPSVLLPIAGLLLLRHRRELAPVCWFGGLLLVGTALVFPVASLAGTFYHDAGALAPALAVGSVWAVRTGVDWVAAARHWRRDLSGLAYGALLAVVVAQLILTLGVTGAQHQAEARRLAVVATWLADHPGELVISSEPYNLSYQTGGAALMLPAGEGTEAVLALARRYGARYVALTRAVGRYPAALADISPPCAAATTTDFCLAVRSPEVEIYAVR
jgi:4-amino-4-deoxy-L-arabinose transferase-like glycosyltransferase